MGTILSTVGSLFVGGVVATAAVVGVVSNATSTSGDSPANVSQPVVEYGSNG